MITKKYIASLFLYVVSFALSGCSQGNRTNAYVSQVGDGIEPHADVIYLAQTRAYVPPDAEIAVSVEEAFARINPGGEIIVTPGTYHFSADLSQLNFDTPVIMRGEGEQVIFDGEGQQTFGLWCVDCSNIVFENITFQNYTDFGIGVEGSDRIAFVNLQVMHNGSAVQLKGWGLEGYGILIDASENISVRDCLVVGNGPDPRKPGLMGTGINLWACIDCEVTGNEVYATSGGGLLAEDSERVLIADNYVHDNYLDATVDGWWDGGLWVDGGHDITVKDNLFENNFGPGLEISDEDNQSPTGYLIQGNTFRGNVFGIYIWNFDTAFSEDQIQLLDNVFEDNQQDIISLGWLD